MSEYIITGTEEEDKAILAHINISIQEWLQHAYDEKARVCIDRIVEATTAFNPKKMNKEDKHSIISTLEFEPQSNERQLKDIVGRIIKKGS
jgi:hypothetical protein